MIILLCSNIISMDHTLRLLSEGIYYIDDGMVHSIIYISNISRIITAIWIITIHIITKDGKQGSSLTLENHLSSVSSDVATSSSFISSSLSFDDELNHAKYGLDLLDEDDLFKYSFKFDCKFILWNIKYYNKNNFI